MRTATWAVRAASTFAFFALLVPASGMAQSVFDGEWQVGAAATSPRLTINGRLLSGHTGCRDFTAEVQGTLARGRVLVGPLNGPCTPAQQRVEDRFLSQLRSAQTLTVRNDRLEARSRRGTLVFSGTRLAVSTRPRPATGTDGSWRPVSVSGRSPPSLPGSAQIMRVTGSRFLLEGHCNTYSGTAAFGPIRHGTGTFGVFISDQTQRMCADSRMEAGDSQLMAALESARGYRYSGAELLLIDTNGNILLAFRSN